MSTNIQMKRVVRKSVTVAGVIIAVWVLASGRAKSQSVAASPLAPGNPESYPQETSSELDMSQMMQMQMTGMNQHAMNMERAPETFLGEIQYHSTSGTSA